MTVRDSTGEQPQLQGLPPLIAGHPRFLVLGSMPGAASLAAQQYYAHPQNAFWPIMGALFGFDAALPYPARTEALVGHGVAVWDVVASCQRATSLDRDIVTASVAPNPIGALLRAHPTLVRVILNGRGAADLFARHVAGVDPGVRVVTAPSTSPANAGMSRAAKLERWREAVFGG